MNALDAARDVLARNIAPLPVPHKSKAPVLPARQKLRISAADIATYFNGAPQNVGALNGAASGNLATVDLDSLEAWRAAERFLPDTGLISGRGKRPRSHPHYRTDAPAKTTRYDDPLRDPSERGHRLLELLGDRTQVLVWGTHPSGDTYRWDASGEPAPVPLATLRRACGLTASAALLGRHWPGKGPRHDCACALGGWLVRGGLPVDDAAELVACAAGIAGDEQAADRAKDVRSTAERLAAGTEVTGGRTLATLLDPKLLDTVSGWLGFSRPAPGRSAPSASPEQGPPTPVLRRVRDIPRTTVDWLVAPYFPRGRVSYIEGHPGVGKSWALDALIAAVSSGGRFAGRFATAHGPVLLLQDEDDWGAVVRPRLEDIGADLDNVVAVLGVLRNDTQAPLPFDDTGLWALVQAIVEVRPVLVAVDPVVSFLGGALDMHRANEVRAVMRPLAALAEEHTFAAVCVRHLTKGSRDNAVLRGLGSIDFTALARSVLLVGTDPDDARRSVLVPTKANLTKKGPALAFTVDAGRFVWLGESNVTAVQLLTPEEDASPREEAERFLRELLADGPAPAKEALALAREAGIAERTLRRARAALGVVAEREGATGKRGGGRWVWSLPADPVATTGGTGPADGPGESEGYDDDEGLGRPPQSVTNGPPSAPSAEKAAGSSKGSNLAPITPSTPTAPEEVAPLTDPDDRNRSADDGLDGHFSPLRESVRQNSATDSDAPLVTASGAAFGELWRLVQAKGYPWRYIPGLGRPDKGDAKAWWAFLVPLGDDALVKVRTTL